MTHSELIAEQMRRMMTGGAWHGPALLESLDGLTAAQAAAHPIAGAHSIWELVLHIDVTQRLLQARLWGESPEMTDADFFPPVADTSDVAWKSVVARVQSQEAELIQAVAALSDERLAQPITPGASTVYETFHGHVQHNAFHTGQIRLLRKSQS